MCRALGSIPSPTLKQTNKQTSGVLVAHTCNPSCSGGRDQEVCASKPAQAKKFMGPYLENPFTKMGLVECLKVKALSTQYCKKKKKCIK
jgi:hypothetical protein